MIAEHLAYFLHWLNLRAHCPEAPLIQKSCLPMAKDKGKIMDRQKLRLNFILGRMVAVEQRLTDSGF